MAKQTVAVYTLTSGRRVNRARTSLAEALTDADIGDPDDAGVFELSIDAESPEEACALVRDAFGRAGTGDDFVIRETTEGREMPADDPRQGTEGGAAAGPDRSARVADAASAVAAAASGAASSAGDSAREAATSAAESARAAATSAADSVREAVDEKGVSGAASDYASTAADAARQSPLRRLAPIAGLIVLLAIVRRRRR